jgi:ubiquinone/menaquinone biosynthesis C-methylase UbiE
MTQAPVWQFDEMKFTGVDFSLIEEVAAYDNMHKKLRNYAEVSEQIVRRLSLNAHSTVIDLGCGTGAFALHAANTCHTIYAVDISAAMLEYCRKQAEQKGITNIVYCHGGLLSYEHSGELADAVVCVAVLHHLPDYWKQVALTRMYGMLKPGGRLLLFDIVFPSDTDRLDHDIDEWINTLEKTVDARLAQESIIHIRDEFSTYDWILEGMIRRSRFRIDSVEYGPAFYATFVCTK